MCLLQYLYKDFRVSSKSDTTCQEYPVGNKEYS